MHVDVYVDPGALPDDVGGDAGVLARVVAAHRVQPQLLPPPDLLSQPPSVSTVYRVSGTWSLGTPPASVLRSLYQLMAGAGLLSTTQSSTSASRPSISGAGAGAEGEIVTFGTTGQGISVLVLVGLNLVFELTVNVYVY